MVVEVEHPRAGRIALPGVPVKLSDTAPGIRRPAPTLGQHTDDVLRELGYDEAAVRDLRQRKVV
jgi:crotonobetainyl-CoA:carnitine CoA-transferase CaiB-like acyl-CoA transferase